MMYSVLRYSLFLSPVFLRVWFATCPDCQALEAGLEVRIWQIDNLAARPVTGWLGDTDQRAIKTFNGFWFHRGANTTFRGHTSQCATLHFQFAVGIFYVSTLKVEAQDLKGQSPQVTPK